MFYFAAIDIAELIYICCDLLLNYIVWCHTLTLKDQNKNTIVELSPCQMLGRAFAGDKVRFKVPSDNCWNCLKKLSVQIQFTLQKHGFSLNFLLYNFSIQADCVSNTRQLEW